MGLDGFRQVAMQEAFSSSISGLPEKVHIILLYKPFYWSRVLGESD